MDNGRMSREARERYNEQRRQKRAAEKASQVAATAAEAPMQVTYEDSIKIVDVTPEQARAMEQFAKPKAHKLAVGGTNKKGRVRNFATVVYPDSAPSNWQLILSEQRVPAFISPLHDKDVCPEGEVKKPHWHVMYIFDGAKSDEQVEALIAEIGGVGLERVNSLRGYARYLCHMDNPEKHQYSQDEVQSLCGADYIGTIGLITDKYKAIGEMIDYCEQNGCISYSSLLIYACVNRSDWFRVLCDSGTVVIKEYLKSKAWSGGMMPHYQTMPEPRNMSSNVSES